MPWDNLVNTANKAEARAKIEGSIYLDQQCPKEKRSLKMSLNIKDDQAKDKANQAGQSFEAEKFFNKARKKKKKKDCQGRHKRPAGSPTTGANVQEG